MVNKAKAEGQAVHEPVRTLPGKVQYAVGWLGVIMAVPFFLWVPLALVTPLPSMIDVFGVVGLRFPASITIGGLLIAAIGFHKF